MAYRAHRKIASALVILTLTLLAAPPWAWAFAEWYLAGFVGGAVFGDTDPRFTAFGRSTDNNAPAAREALGTFPLGEFKARDVSLDASPVLGAKAGACPKVFAYVCAEVEFDFFQPELDRQPSGHPPVSPAPSFTVPPLIVLGQLLPEPVELSRFDFSAYNLGLNLIGRLPLLAEPDYPLGGRLHLYAGAGPSFVWTKAENKDCIGRGPVFRGRPAEGGVFVENIGAFTCAESDTEFAVGVQALGGVKFFFTRHLAVFAEYKFKHWTSDFTFSPDFRPAPGVPSSAARPPDVELRHVDFDAHLFYVGLGLHF